MILPLSQFSKRAHSVLGPATEEQLEKLGSVGLPKELFDIFSTEWLSTYGHIDGLEIFDIESITEELSEKYIERIPQAGYLPIGKSGSGDILVVDFKEVPYSVGFILIAEWDVSFPPQDHAYLKIADSFEEFISIASKKRSFIDRIRGRYPLPSDPYEIDQAVQQDASRNPDKPVS